MHKYVEAIGNYETLRNVCKTTKDYIWAMEWLIKIANSYQGLKLYDKGKNILLRIYIAIYSLK